MGVIPGLRELNLTDTQREQIKAVMDAHKGEFDAQMQKAGPARKALNDAVMAETFNEATVRQKATDLATAEADGAVLRAKVFSEVWALLTPEQQVKARELKSQAEQRMGQMRQRFEEQRGQRQGRPKRGQ
jgi:Spy/CpxP family protein refolding chaperone